jgi:hypothetical protein
MKEEFKGTVILPRLVSHDKATGIKNVVGYMNITGSENDPAYFFNVIYSQKNIGDTIGIINIIVYNKVYSKDVATIDGISITKLYQMVNAEKLIPYYSKGWSDDDKAYIESGEKPNIGKPYAEAVELWLNQIFKD